MTTRVLPPAGGGNNRVNRNGYIASPGQFLDVPDADALALATMGWTITGSAGTTVQRQTNIVPTGPVHHDTQTGATLIHDGSVFRNPLTGKPG